MPVLKWPLQPAATVRALAGRPPLALCTGVAQAIARFKRTPFPAQARSPNETEAPSKRRTVQAGTRRTSQAIDPARPERARLARPSEPSLFPKLRLQFADFPYLHLPMDQRLLTLETWCGFGYGLTRPDGWRGRTYSLRVQRAKDTLRLYMFEVILYRLCLLLLPAKRPRIWSTHGRDLSTSRTTWFPFWRMVNTGVKVRGLPLLCSPKRGCKTRSLCCVHGPGLWARLFACDRLARRLAWKSPRPSRPFGVSGSEKHIHTYTSWQRRAGHETCSSTLCRLYTD